MMQNILAVLSWWLLIQLIGLAAWPLAFRLLRWLPDRGYTAGKPLGLLLTSFVLWLLGSIGLVQNSLGGIIFALAVVVAASAYVLSRDGVPALYPTPLRDWLREHRTLVIVYETLFLVAMCGWAAYRATNPAIASTEKPMEYMFLNSILRSPTFPPQDAWLSGFGISYYYFGYVMMAVMTRLSGVASGVAYNVSHGLWFALIAGGAFSVAFNVLQAKQDAQNRPLKIENWNLIIALLAAVFVVFLGNLEGTLELAHLNGLGSPELWKWLDIKDINGPAGTPAGGEAKSLRFYWWWRASRVVHDYTLQGGDQEVIDEFPFFSFLNGDLHPHTLAYPFVFLAISLALNVYQDAGGTRNGQAADAENHQRAPHLSAFSLHPFDLLLYAICLGALGFLNTWDFPIYLALVVAAYALRQWHTAGTLNNQVVWDTVKLGAILGGVGFVLYLPFYISFQSQARGILPNLFNATRFPQFLVMFGQFAVPGGLLLLALAALRSRVSAWRFWLGSLGWTAVILIGVTVLGVLLGLLTPAARMALQAWLSDKPIPGLEPNIGRFVSGRLLERLFDPWTAVWLALAMVVIFKLIRHPVTVSPRQLVAPSSGKESEPLAHPSVPFILLLLLFGAGLALSVEFIYLADSFSTRMNTVFKFYYQVWALWGVAAACAIGLILNDDKLWGPYRVATGVVTALLIVGGLAYPLTAISTLGDRKHLTLDGTDWVKQQSPDDYAAIQWLNQNVAGSPVILEAPGQSYRAETSRISAFTGLPTVLGWGGHELQWRGNYDEAGRREPDIKKLYTTALGTTALSTTALSTTRDEQETLTLLDKYAISYVYVGPVERATYSVAGLLKFDALMDVAFRQGNVTIYKRK